MIAEDWPFEQSSTTELPPPRHFASTLGEDDRDDARQILRAAMYVVAASRAAFLTAEDAARAPRKAN